MSIGNSYEQNIIATDENDRILKFESSNDFGKFYREFVACMARKGHGRVLNKDSSGPPTRPDRAYRRVQNGYSNSSDQKDIDAYVKADESFKTHCEIVFASAKRAIGNSIRSYLDTVMDSMDDGSYKNILRMFRHLRKKYGGWTDQKGQRNYYAIIAIPKFDSFE